MKVIKSTTLLASILTILFLASCGSDNKTVPSKTPTSGTNPATTPTTGYHPTDTHQFIYAITEFKKKVVAGSFRRPLGDFTVTYRDYINSIEIEDHCSWDWLTCNSYSQDYDRKGYFDRSEIDAVVHHENGEYDSAVETTHQAVINKLINILNKKKFERRMGDAAYEITTTENKVYFIDLNVPVAVNPVYYYNLVTGEGYYYEGCDGYGCFQYY
ncbi:MAG: hypothetical protein A2504_04795 [Bdellovibrionales bacterium RIFOXYD12_FULL_39_22]|nr:MAG: hypothetical protein A2385_07030 [Bdellovibrionales bacterium RIFOXYB1_FULL_39_21]OFZ42016.1 MAG: hypothetical protein A2485_09000 [Bdellovibrionales bacterium RIFOXYC12_FULL_39_17]OFZ50732.1 MAG: hypothetical protein A2404_05950 [Bdellovibrionales bacterium RIFOXYC1_FULL_39_130]OFZ69500.1 MAG: hypothetical protein A2451_02465 [Bdellovibrionales bacterium RIFOXYC2_FULL_39_8]OFZ77955.1 MAG: hypothetical protein A2560_01120 [Bdellovibrionales bacterium RIFOXYD1_FULL_39_84]OFZ93609.1 MAG: